jgi:hypothetical protein
MLFVRTSSLSSLYIQRVALPLFRPTLLSPQSSATGLAMSIEQVERQAPVQRESTTPPTAIPLLSPNRIHFPPSNRPSPVSTTAARRVYSIPDIRQRTFPYLGTRELAKCMRIERGLIEDVARELYRDLSYNTAMNEIDIPTVSDSYSSLQRTKLILLV